MFNPSIKTKLLLLTLLLCGSAAVARDEITDVLADRALNMSRPADRAQAVKRIEAIENARLQNARAKGRAMGLPLRMEKPEGGVKELIDFVDDKPVYLETMNADAAISTAANLVQTSPYTLDGSGLTVAVWDAAGSRLTHREFATGTGSRLTNMNGTSTNYHSMHVAGTIAALGVNPLSRGMANNAKIHSFDWNSDVSEMLAAGATASNQAATKVYLSNHSYGVARGWSSGTWTGTGTNQNAYASDFGQYGSAAQELDAAIYSTPYFLSFWSAGNERDDNPPTGSSVRINGTTVVYNPVIHPPGDGVYRNGYETMGYRNLAKNIVTVGAVNDAVTSGLRDLSKATISGFSSTGPTDDGRIKPDLVANGVNLTSTDTGADDDYLTISGTSMSSPNACGSATLLVDQYKRLFGGAMRASTLKALLIQTADDLGNPGPDYFFGWGLINVKRAADLLIEQRNFPITQHVTESQVSTTVTNRKYNFIWDGVSPINATLAWTDPAGVATSAHDSRTPTLVNNLNLKLIAPNGTEYFPFVMPFVGQWTVASMSQNATTGINNVDNVEQVLIANPGQAGSWQVVVSYSGPLANSLQEFGLILSGSTTDDRPLVINSISPATAASGASVTTDITGEELSADTVVRLRQPGRADIIGTAVQLINPTTLRCQFNLGGAAAGLWSVVGTNPDSKTATLADAFTITGTSITDLWRENFDATVSGWSSQSATGSNSWAITTAQSHSPTSSYFAAGPDTTSTTWLVSPPVAIPASYSNLQIEFWHQYDLQSQRDGGRFSLSVDNGVTWFDVTDADSGASFISNGYNTTMASTGQTGAFAGLQAWSGVSSGFVRTAIDLHNIPKFAGKNLRMRWGLSTNNQTASNGWHVDSVALVSDSSTPNHAPIITVAASTSSAETQTVGPTTYQIIRDTGADLTVSATDDAGENDLVYTWSSSGPVAVTYNTNGDNSAKNATLTFYATGDYIITASVRDTGGLTTTSFVNVRVLATSSLRVTPDPAVVQITTTRQFNAVVADQFGIAAVTQPSPITWSVSGGGSMDSNGLFTATTLGGPYVVTATGGAFSKNVDLTVTPLAKTFTGSSSSSADNWNIATRWTPSGVPTGLVDVTIADGKVVTCDLDSTPTYSGDLTLGAGSLLQAGWGSNTLGVFNVFGSPATTTITMGQGSKIATRGNFSPEIPAIVLIGDAEFSMGSSNPPGTDPDFKYGITGPYVFTLNGKSDCSAKLSAPGNFGELYLTNQSGVNFTVDADVAGSLGGDVTMLANPSTGGPCAILRVNAANAMSDTATLSLYGNVGPLVTFNANDTIGNLVINGVKQAAGTYTSSSNFWWLGGTGTVTVAGPVIAYWNPSGGPGGTWDASAIWNNQANLAGTDSPWSAGQVANFNAAGNYAVSITGTQDIGGLAVSNGTVTMSGGGLRLIGAIPTPVATGASLTIGTAVSEGVGEGSLHKTGGGTLILTGNNTFTGPTVIGGGIVSVASLANGEEASPLGQYPYAGAGGLLLAGGTLQYTGGTTAVDRGFTFSGNSTIDVSTPGTALALGNSRTLKGVGQLTVTGGAGSTLSLGNFTSTAGMGITFNPTGVSMNVASLEGSSPYPLSSAFTLGGNSTGNVISGNVYASTYPGSPFQQGTSVIKTGTGDWTINGVFSSIGALTVESGTLTLKGSNTFDGTTTLKGAKLVFDYTTSNTSKMAGALTLAGGTLELKNGSHSEAVSSTTLNAGPTTLLTRNGGTARLRMNAITRNAGGSISFLDGTVADTDRSDTNGILGGYATIGANWASNIANAGDGIITALAAYDTWANSGGSATANYLLNGGGALGGALAANSLKIANTAISQTLILGSNNLTITSTAAATLGGLLYAGGSDERYTINGSGGILASSTTGELIIHTHTGALTVNAPVVTSTATAGLLTKTGAGSLILGGTNNVYTGATRVAGGKLFINGILSDNTSTVTVEAGTVLGGSGTIRRHIVIAAGGGFEFNLGSNAASHVPLTHLATRNLTFSGSSVLTITSSGGASPGLYTLITDSKSIIGSAPATVILPDGWAADPPVIAGNKLQINITTAVTNPNLPPVWTSNPVIESNATEAVAYSSTLANDVTDANSNPLTFAKISGPAWLVVAPNGTLSGTPAYSNVGANVFTVNVSDGIAAPVTATLNITVDAAFSNPPLVVAGPDQTVSLVVGQPWTPVALAPLAWYDATDSLTVTASGGLVSQWSDKSGNANHMLPAGPTNQPATGTSNINGLNAIAFDGTSDALKTTTNPFGASISNAMVMAVVDIGSLTNSALFSLTGSSTSANRWQGHCPNANGGIYFDCGGVSGGNRLSVLPSPAWPAWPANEKKLLGFYCSTTASVQRVWTNGSQLLGDASGHTVNTVSGLSLGHDGSASYDNCAMGEVVILNRVVSDADRQKLEGHLAWKWGLQANLPAGHPHTIVAPGGTSAVATLDGTISDPDSDPLTSTWSLLSGPGSVSFGNASAVDTTTTFVTPGTYVLRLTVGDGRTQAFDDVTITVNGVPGPFDHFAISPITSPQTVGTPITGITITAKDASNNTATGFSGAVNFSGTGGFSGNSVGFTNGVLSNPVSVIPTVAGSNLTLTVNDGAGHTGSTTIATINPAQSPYETWAVGGVAFDADTNGDGVKNSMAWLLGALNPSENALDKLPQASRNGTKLRLTFRCLKSTMRGTAQLKVQSSGDLGAADPWTSHEAAVSDLDNTVNGVIFDTTEDGDFINVIADIPSTGANLFGRLQATP